MIKVMKARITMAKIMKNTSEDRIILVEKEKNYLMIVVVLNNDYSSLP